MTSRSEEEVSSRRYWIAIIVATVVAVVAYGSLLLAWFAVVLEDSDVATDGDIAGSEGPFFALGLVLVPFVFIALAFISQRSRAPFATLIAMGLFVLVALPLGLFLHLSVVLAAAFGAGGIVTLARREGYRLSYRVWAVVLTAAYVTGLLIVAPPGGIFAGAVLPLPALGLADMLAVRWTRPRDPEDETDPAT